MGQEIRGFPAFPKHTQTVKLGKARYSITFTWRQRCRAWYFDLRSAAGELIVSGRRLSPLCAPIAHIGFEVGSAPAYLFVRGTDGYSRDDLGATLVLTRYSPDEVAAAKAARDDAAPATARVVVI